MFRFMRGNSSTSLMESFPDSDKSEDYKYQVIKSYYLFAQNSVDEKKAGRYEQVVTECLDFIERFPESKLLNEVSKFQSLSQNNIKAIQNEQVKTSN